MRKHRLYRIWKAMRTRCNNPKSHAYKYYGCKGISICEQWDDYESFYVWANDNGYSDSLTIDRIDNEKDYSPDNCRWITLEEQQRNKSNNIFESINGESLTLKEISLKYGINAHTILTRYTHGSRSLELIKPVRVAKRILVQGENLTLKEISENYNIPYSTIRDRYRKGITDERIIKEKFERDEILNG